jgi:hypothetical protein
MANWKILADELGSILRRYNGGKIYYYTEYLVGHGYVASEGTSDIQNFKKPIDRKRLPEWQYRERAVSKFVQILLEFWYPPHSLLVPAPTSQPRHTTGWNDRLDKAVYIVGRKRADVLVQPLIDIKDAMVSSHRGQGSRRFEDIRSNLVWLKGEGPLSRLDCNDIFIVDDVITTGNHIRAFADIISERYPSIPIHALVWGRSTYVDM